MDSHSSFEDANQEGSFIMSKAVIMTCLVALIYIALVVALMLWCRNKRKKSRADDPENKGENDDTASDGPEEGDEKEVSDVSSIEVTHCHQLKTNHIAVAAQSRHEILTHQQSSPA